MEQDGLLNVIESMLDRVQRCIDYCIENNISDIGEDHNALIASSVPSHPEMSQIDEAIASLCSTIRGRPPERSEWLDHTNQLLDLMKYNQSPKTALAAWMNCRTQLRRSKGFVQTLITERQLANDRITAGAPRFVEKEIIMGDKFENIRNSSIINRSVVNEAIGVADNRMGADISSSLAELAKFVDDSGNTAAAKLFDALSEELTNEEPDKSTLAQYWKGIVSVLPDVAKLAGATAALTKVLS